ncbi:DUF3105 domain-containing protein [Dactylosporangium sp. NPDC049140]|uniref:DUF3105 domain-containing protein n=1 Tax=Dactylosporangium sp. NPDC049140 TaxID=3155647 RepID=UPI0033E7F202
MTGPYPEPPPQYGPPPQQYGPPPPYAPGQPPYAPGQPPYAPGPTPPKSNRGIVIAVVSIVGVLAVLCAAGIVAAVWLVNRENGGGHDDSDEIAGLIDYRLTHPDWLERDHLQDTEQPVYKMVPAAGGRHFGIWQRCAGDVYDKPVVEGRAVHSLEHGAVWITYQPGLAKADVDKLAGKVRNNDFMLMSPYEGQPGAISLQAWGYQLRVDKADDPRVDKFIRRFRETASLEPGTPCSNGTTE